MNSRSVEAEHELIARAQQGDRSAFGELVHRHRQGVVNVVYRMCGEPGLTEDAAQEAFIRAWDRLPDYRPRAPFRNWIYRIAINVARDALRRHRETVNIDDLSLPSLSETPENTMIQKERDERVRRAVLELPPASRAVLILREFEELSYQEIAATLGIPVGTVMSRLSYARGRLRESLAPYLEIL